MIKDTMTKLEVMKVIRKDFDSEVLPYYEKVKNQIMKEILPEAQRKKGQFVTNGFRLIKLQTK